MKINRAKRILVLIASALCAVGLFTVGLMIQLLWPEKATPLVQEPVYKGQTLSQWLGHYEFQASQGQPSGIYIHAEGMGLPVPFRRQDVPAAEALRAMGTNAAASLMSKLRYEDSHRAAWAYDLHWAIDLIANTQPRQYAPPPELAFHFHTDATVGLYILGRDAEPALRQALHDRNRRVRQVAAELLANLPST